MGHWAHPGSASLIFLWTTSPPHPVCPACDSRAKSTYHRGKKVLWWACNSLQNWSWPMGKRLAGGIRDSRSGSRLTVLRCTSIIVQWRLQRKVGLSKTQPGNAHIFLKTCWGLHLDFLFTARGEERRDRLLDTQLVYIHFHYVWWGLEMWCIFQSSQHQIILNSATNNIVSGLWGIYGQEPKTLEININNSAEFAEGKSPTAVRGCVFLYPL